MGRSANWNELEELFSAYLHGDSSATRTLFSEFLRVLGAYFKMRINSDSEAEDLVQATLLKIHFARDRFDPKQSLKTWIFTIASRSLIDHWRGSATEIEIQEPSLDGEGDSELESAPSQLLDPAMKTELTQDLNRALKTLKPMDRSIVYLYGVEGLSMAEIAQALSISEGAAKIRAHRAYLELRKQL